MYVYVCMPNDIYYNNQCSLLIEKPFYLLRPQSFSFQIVSEFILIHLEILCLKDGAFDSLVCSEVRIFVHNDCPRGKVLLPSSRAQGLSGGGGGLDEIDTCIIKPSSCKVRHC